MAHTKLCLLLLTCVVAAHSAHVRGEFGNQRFLIDVEFGNDTMEVTIHRPDNAPDTFRETTNLHIFSKHLVAVRNSRERGCYVRFFVESEDQMKGRVENAEYNNGRIGNVTMERLNVDGIPPLSPRTIKLLLGEEIAEFCRDDVVYMLGDTDYFKLDPRRITSHLNERERRRVQPIDVAGTCCCGCCC